MKVRDQIATQMAAAIISKEGVHSERQMEEISIRAYKMADAMLEASTK